MEKISRPVNGYLALLISLVLIGVGIWSFTQAPANPRYSIVGAACMVVAFFIWKGLMIIQPNHARVLSFFGKYVSSVKENGMFFINPLYASTKISLRAQNLQIPTLKVNDKMGNPIEIAAVIVWVVSDTYKAAYDVVNYVEYVNRQSEAAVRHLANSFPYDNLEDEHADITLRNGGDKVNEILEQELTDRLAPAGIVIREARISHLAYAA